jgi:hypothetical protein
VTEAAALRMAEMDTIKVRVIGGKDKELIGCEGELLSDADYYAPDDTPITVLLTDDFQEYALTRGDVVFVKFPDTERDRSKPELKIPGIDKPSKNR